MAGIAPKDVARRLGVSEDIAGLYEHACFDTRDRLDRPDLVLHVVIGIERVFQGKWYWPDVGWKLLGYLLGPAALDYASPARGITPDRPWRRVKETLTDAADVALVSTALQMMLGAPDSRKVSSLLSSAEKLYRDPATAQGWPDSNELAEPWRRTTGAARRCLGARPRVGGA